MGVGRTSSCAEPRALGGVLGGAYLGGRAGGLLSSPISLAGLRSI